VKREEPSTESPRVSRAGNVVYRKPIAAVSGRPSPPDRGLPTAGVRPVPATGAVPSSFLGVGLFGNAAQSGW